VDSESISAAASTSDIGIRLPRAMSLRASSTRRLTSGEMTLGGTRGGEGIVGVYREKKRDSPGMRKVGRSVGPIGLQEMDGDLQLARLKSRSTVLEQLSPIL
jgi:hypothetical protein